MVTINCPWCKADFDIEGPFESIIYCPYCEESFDVVFEGDEEEPDQDPIGPEDDDYPYPEFQ